MKQRESRSQKAVFKKSKLVCGATLVTEQLPQFQSLSIGVWVKTGARHELKGEEGLSHFLEHMLFKGTESRTALQIAQEIDQVGGEFNAFTAREYTCFHLLTLSQDVELAIDIVSDVLLNSRFDEAEIEREKKVILQEISMVEDNPEEFIYDVFFEQAFGKHSLGKPILGRPKQLEAYGRKAIYRFFQKHYDLKKLVIAVVGNVDHKTVEKHFNKYLKYSVKQKKHVLEKNLLIKNKAVAHPGFQSLRRSFEQSHIVVGFPAFAYNSPIRFSALLLNVYLGGGMSSALFQEIREKRGLAYTVYSSISPFSDSGLFSIYVGTNPSEVKTCLAVIASELLRLKLEPLKKNHLDIIKNNLKGTLLLNSDSVENRMTSIAKGELFFGKYFSTEDTCKFIDRVDSAQIKSVANKIFKAENAIITTMGPNFKKDWFKNFQKIIS